MKNLLVKLLKLFRSMICFDYLFPRRCWNNNSKIYLKFFFSLTLIYLINLFFGLKDYLWSEKSFEDEFHLTINRIDLNLLDENHPEKLLGQPKFDRPNKFLIENPNLCRIKTNENEIIWPQLFIFVKSAIENVEARQAIRRTWAKKTFLDENSIRLAFVLGKDPKNVSIENESNQYEDLIQIDRIDNYYHNSYKMVMMLEWISRHCHEKSIETIDKDLRRYVLFIDDDYYLNIQHLINYLNKLNFDKDLTKNDRRTFLTGYVYKDSRPRRFINDRWFISIDDYPYDRYPPYVTAGCFLMTRSNANLFSLASKYFPLFRFDDIYIGLLAYSMSISIVENNSLFSSYSSSSSSSLIISSKRNKWIDRFQHWLFNMISKKENQTSIEPLCLHGYRGNDLIQFWNDIYQTNISLLHRF